MNTQTKNPVRSIHTAGLLCFWAALLGAASGVYLAVVEPAVPESRFSFPLDAPAFTAIQAFFAVQHLGLLLGLMALGWAGAVGGSRMGRIGHVIAMAAMGAFTATELAAIAAASETKDSPVAGLLGPAYGVFTLLTGLALVLVGVAVLKAGVWQGWRRWVPLALGMWVFVPMLPALALSFNGARFAIAGWMLLFAAMGWALVKHAEGIEQNGPLAGRAGRSHLLPKPAP